MKSTYSKIHFDIVIIQSSFDSKYGAIGHRNVLGTIMSLGIERNTFGDIVVTDDTITIFATKEISSYLIKNLTYRYHLSNTDSQATPQTPLTHCTQQPWRALL